MTGASPFGAVQPVPVGASARRLEWAHLPPDVRALVEDRIGARVVEARSQDSGFTPGFASVLACDDGSRHFVKAASCAAQRAFAESYREEARKLAALPSGVPVPALVWFHDDGAWVVLETEHVEARVVPRPWEAADLDACLDTLEVLADALTPPPLPLVSFTEEYAGLLAGWAHARSSRPGLPGLEEAADLARRGLAAAGRGDATVHTDARDDNFLLTREGAVLCDWNWPVVGAPWVDTVILLVSAYGDGLDADAVLGRRRLTRDVPADDVDGLLALLAGFFLERADQSPVAHSPHLRRHAGWWRNATWGWLAHRRGW